MNNELSEDLIRKAIKTINKQPDELQLAKEMWLYEKFEKEEKYEKIIQTAINNITKKLNEAL